MNRSTRRALLTAIITAASMHVIVGAQGQVSQNINVVSGSANQFIGDMFRQRQNEAVIGISSVNPSHMMAVYNDYRTVDFVDGFVPPSPIQTTLAKVLDFFRVPFRREREGRALGKAEIAAAQAWVGLSFSDNAGKDWYTGLLPGHASLLPAEGTESWDQSPQLTQYDAASDPVMATTPDQFFVGGIVFTPGGSSAGIVSRFTDKNDTATGQNIHFDGTRVLLTVPAGLFVDKPSIAAGPNGHVYVAFVVFDQSDPQKLSSKIVFFRSTDYGVTWSPSPGDAISQPLSRNQSPWIVVDPNNENIVYIGWRVFSIKTGGWANAIVGRKSTNGGASFTPSVPYPVALLLKAFDAPQVSLSATTLQIPRSNAYPTAAIDGNGAIHVAMQEYVYPANHSVAALRGLPLLPGVLTTKGVPRITVTTSYNGGATWTLRKAVDLGTTANPAGTQFMPVLTAVGEPGPSCSGQSGPSSRIMLMYYDARAGGIGTAAGTNGAVAGGDRQFDVRIAHASACTRDALGRPIFGPSEQLSRYTRSATYPHGIVTTAGEIDGEGVTAVNRAYSMFCGGNCAFTGDYIHLTPRVPYVQTAAGWKLTTATGVDKNSLPAPVVQGVWADMRDAVVPTEGALRPVPLGASPIDALPWNVYSPPGTGQPACVNPGSRDQNIYTAEYAPGQLFAAAPESFRASSIPRAYPLYVENRAGQQRYFRLTIDAAANASFDVASYAAVAPAPLNKTADIAVGPYSSVTGSVVIGAGQSDTVLITVAQLDTTTDGNGNQIQSGNVLANGAKTTLALHAAGETAAPLTQTHTPVVAPTPVLTYPFAGRLPITIPAGSTFSESPFSQTTFEQNPFSQTPFSQTPFSQTVTIHEVTDVSFEVTLDGTDAAAFAAQLAVQNVLDLKGSYLFQVLINRIASTNALDGCESIDRPKDIQVSSIVTPFSQTPFSQTPFSQTPFSQTPFSQTPFSQTPFSQTPFSQTPFSQTSDPRDPAVSNSTFYIAPPGTSSPSYRAARRIDKVNYVLRVFQMKPSNDATLTPFISPAGEVPVGLTVISDTPEIIVLPGGGLGFDPGGGSTGSGGAAVPVKLGFVVQPTSTAFGQPVTPAVQVAIQDGFGNTLTASTAQVTIAIGTNPAGGTLSGTLTKNAVAGIATFDGLSINNPAVGYTLVASSSGLASASSTPFNIVAVPLPNRLAFVVQPTSSPANLTIAPPIQVAVQDASGNPTTSSASVQLDIFPNPGNAVLSGLTTKDAVNGVATFSNLSINPAGTGYTLRAQSAGLASATSLPFNIIAPPPTALFSVLNTDFVSAGFGSMRGGNGTGTITVAGVSGTVTRALLFWNGPSDSSDPAANATVTFAGSSGTGANSGFASSNCWGFANTQSYRADVTGLVTGNGTYSLSNFRKAGPPVVDMNGVSLIVFFDDPQSANKRDVYLLSTNDSNMELAGFDAANWNSVIPGVQYGSGVGVLQLHVGDGQGFGDGGIVLNGTTVVPAGPNFQGNTVPPNVGQIITEGSGAGGLWDIKSWDIPPALLIAGPNTLTLTSATASDCLSLVVMLVSVPHVPPVQ